MAARQIIYIKGVEFKLFGKSIKVEGVAKTFFLEREPTKEDCEHFWQLIKAGRNQLREELEAHEAKLKSLMRHEI